jgi:hypothetical protein
LLQMAPHVLPDLPALAIFLVALAALLAWQVGLFKLLLGGAALGVLLAALST